LTQKIVSIYDSTNFTPVGSNLEIVFGSSFSLLIKHHFFSLSATNEVSEFPYLLVDSWGKNFWLVHSVFFAFFVFPISWLLFLLMNTFSFSSLGILFSLFLVTAVLKFTVIQGVSQEDQLKFQRIKEKTKEIQNRYSYLNNPTAKEDMQKEIIGLYKRENFNPLSSLFSTFGSFPLLIAMFFSLRVLRAVKTASL